MIWNHWCRVKNDDRDEMLLKSKMRRSEINLKDFVIDIFIISMKQVLENLPNK